MMLDAIDKDLENIGSKRAWMGMLCVGGWVCCAWVEGDEVRGGKGTKWG